MWCKFTTKFYLYLSSEHSDQYVKVCRADDTLSYNHGKKWYFPIIHPPEKLGVRVRVRAFRAIKVRVNPNSTNSPNPNPSPNHNFSGG